MDLKANEDLSVVRGLGSLAFVRAQGRTLKEQSQEKVLALVWAIRGELESLRSLEYFDERHHAWVQKALQVLRTNRNSQLAYRSSLGDFEIPDASAWLRVDLRLSAVT